MTRRSARTPPAGHPGEKVTEGLDGRRARLADIAEVTLTCLRRTVPAAGAGIAFVSGGQSGDLATARLTAINAAGSPEPWPVAFSFGRAIQQPALTIWDGQVAHVAVAQRALRQRAHADQAARRGTRHPRPATWTGG